MKRRLMIARALMHEPKLLILDEPTAGVDIELRRSMWGFLKDLNDRKRHHHHPDHTLPGRGRRCCRRNIGIIQHGELVEDSLDEEPALQAENQKPYSTILPAESALPKLRGMTIAWSIPRRWR